MFVINKSKKDIEVRSFEGYEFSIPSGVVWLWDKLGEHLLKNIYKIEVTEAKLDKYGFDNGHGVPDLLESNEAAWVKGGKKLASVKRFQVVPKLIGREAIIDVARARGLSKERVMQYMTDKRIDIDEIANDINLMPVPEDVRYPSDKIMNEDDLNE